MPNKHREPQADVDSDAISRRAFLGAGAAASAGLWLNFDRVSLWAAEEPPPRRVTTGAPQVFVDLEATATSENVQHAFHAAEKHPENPVLLGSRDWERQQGGPTGSFIYDEEDKLFKVWYQGIIGTRPGSDGNGPYTLNYAVSQDGVHWERPNLGLHEFTFKDQRTRDNNIVVPQTHHNGKDHWESVLKDPLATDPRQRYKAVGWSSYSTNTDGAWCGSVGECGIYSMTSPDGLNWTHSTGPVFHYRPRPGSGDLGPVGDAQSLMIDRQKKQYVAFLRGTQRNRLFSVSQDFIDWTPPAESMPAISGKAGSPLYNHMGFNYGDQHLGLVTHYAVEDDGVHHLRVRLLFSRDGVRFMAAGPDPYQRPALVDVGQIGEWDRFMCMITGAPPIRFGDKMYIYYRGYSETHNRSGQKPGDSFNAGANGLATIRADGFASVGAGFDGGRVTTKPIVFDGGKLSINAKANFHASVKVEVLDERGAPLAGFSAVDCVPMTQDSVDAPIRWKERTSLAGLAGRPVRLRFHLTNARLYAYRIA